jgi:hypothetical protein
MSGREGTGAPSAQIPRDPLRRVSSTPRGGAPLPSGWRLGHRAARPVVTAPTAESEAIPPNAARPSRNAH